MPRASTSSQRLEAVSDELAGEHLLQLTERNPETLVAELQRQKAGDALPSSNIYCKNIPLGIEEMEVRLLFSSFGEVASCRILCHGDATGKGGSAMVRMATVQEAMLAVQGLRGKYIGDSLHPFVVRFADSAETKARKQIKQGLASLTLASARSDSSARPPVNIAMASSGNSFVLPQPPLQLQVQSPVSHNPYARQNENSGPLSSSQLQPVSMLPQLRPIPSFINHCSSSLYVANLPPESGKLYLYETFSPFGAILSAKIITNEKGVSKGIAFVNFSDSKAAAAALSALNNLPVGDRKLYVTFQTRRQKD